MSNLTGLVNLVVNSLELIDETTGSQSEVRTLIANNGVKGLKGDPGIQGTTGLKGDPGSKGETLVQTSSGPVGDKGDTGQQGPQGVKGERGYQGVAGNDGAKGDAGAAGAKGDIGDAGVKGDAGTKGAKGDLGSTGNTGPQGNSGATGAKGDLGSTGATGSAGSAGAKGQKGASASVGTSLGINTTAPTGDTRLLVHDGNLELRESTLNTFNQLNFTTFQSQYFTAARIESVPLGNYNSALAFSVQGYALNNYTRQPLEYMRINPTGNIGIGYTNPSDRLAVNGSLSATSKAFDIPHPDPAKPNMRLRHTCIETPSCGGVQYKYQLQCIKGANEFPLPSYIQHLATDLMCWVSPYKIHATAYAEVVGSTLHVNCSKNGLMNVLIFGDRCDSGAMDCDRPIEYESKS